MIDLILMILAPVFGALATVPERAKKLTRYGRPEEGGLWWMHWQNLSAEEKPRSWPWNGRAWVNRAPHGETWVRFEWAFPRDVVNVAVKTDRSEGDVLFTWVVPPLALYLGCEGDLAREVAGIVGDREVSITAGDQRVWWNLGMNPHEYRSTTPRWRQGSINLVDVLLGEEQVTYAKLDVQKVAIAFVEGSYDATVELENVALSRPRSPFTRSFRVGKVSVDGGVPVPGKGEWDCGDDALRSSSAQVKNAAEAIGNFVTAVYEMRMKRGGPRWAPEAKLVAESPATAQEAQTPAVQA